MSHLPIPPACEHVLADPTCAHATGRCRSCYERWYGNERALRPIPPIVYCGTCGRRKVARVGDECAVCAPNRPGVSADDLEAMRTGGVQQPQHAHAAPILPPVGNGTD
jgi:hypothetical protein